MIPSNRSLVAVDCPIENRAGRSWDEEYLDGPPPWDIGRPQPAVVRLGAAGGFDGSVLDAGCGTGENALHIAELGLPVLGVDIAETAISAARSKAKARGVAAEFAVADATQLDGIDRTFDTVLDCGLFHSLDDDLRPHYVRGVTSLTKPGATFYVICFRDEGADAGPHPVSEQEIRGAFNPATGWAIASLDRDRVDTLFHPNGATVWLATLKRTTGSNGLPQI